MTDNPNPAWRITVDIPMSLADTERERLFVAVADAVHGWEPPDRDGWDASVSAGLLADPAQTTEQHAERLDRALWLWAEEKWRREQLLAQREQWWEHVGRERAQLESERDERQARIDEIADVLGRAPGDATSAEIVEIVRTAVAVKGRRRDEAMELRARIDAVTATCEAADVMVRMGMATSTLRWETAKAVLDDVRAALVGDQGKHLGENQAKSGGSEALTSGNSWANRDLDLSGAALRAVEEADDAAGDLP